ncbi:hypothetical protein NUU61_003778 [Penicillium alfredii]|uniref:PI-PLC Y-box domain-containing protein n=1 Tax=Penicillium alfredii TaxID=1506179 RepID=A0A9W9FJT9_9EURO|nr:uncharacterized protein NUU61_003778 [Penicillium alfredii]KAJ5101556.1 hypothetical protein NUU61_003778 [Penicillium alfredii]
MSRPGYPTDSSIVMAEQSSRDVVDQTLSGGEPSSSDVPASTNDKQPAGGDVGETNHIATTATPRNLQSSDETTNTFGSREGTGGDKNAGGSPMDPSKQGTGLVASRALELNGLASASDGGDDTASQGGSESDASRTDGRHHTRTGSVKKPGSFKPVSFAKFSVPKAPGVPAPPKAPEKVPSTSTTPLGTPQPSSRPRLVAKPTAGMRDAFSKTGPGGSNPTGTGPDPSQVWNKNRPVQPTPAKHLTDEELKQQYGIHMTSRIQEDGGGSEAKWADIDDDEDDWAPETIEWTDGTKVTLTHNEPAPPPTQDDRGSKEIPPSEPSMARELVKAAPKPTSVGPNPTVLRLGANAERQAKSTGVSAKGMNDKVPSASTSPAPPPAKSPWAALPPVERMSPVNPPVQLSHQPRPLVGQPPRDDPYHAPLPPKEIAADDFNRTWRETQPNAPRELYNSRSGRYEPVSDNRRGSWRHDQNRAPSVLQRPNYPEPSGPAEPSPAFQTYRSGMQDGMGWNRRRTSSNVSGGSGSYGRRMSVGRPDAAPRYFEARRGSQVNGMVDPALLGREQPHLKEGHFREPSPTRHHVDPSRAARSANTNDGAPAEAPPTANQAPEVPQEDPVALQQRIMKEKRMEARQRRIEQEEKEEAAKQERIRQRLAALGPPPDKSKRRESIGSRKSQAPVQAPSASNTATIHSPPKPPVPEPTGEPKQYGMMKVHHPDTVKKLVAANERDRASDKPAMPNLRRGSSPHREPKRELSPAAGLRPQPESHPPVQDKPDDTRIDEHGAQWRGNLNVSGSYSPWSANPNLGPTSPSVKNPWKPLSSDRTLGNGIFEQSLGGFPARDLALRSQLAMDQSPMAAPPQAFSGPARSPQEPASISPLLSPEVRHASYDPLSPIGPPGPIGPPSSQQSQWQNEPRQPGGLAAWNNFHAVAAKREAEEAEKYRQEFNSNRNGPPKIPPSTFKETWKQVRIGNDPSHKQVARIVKTQHGGPPSNPLTNLDAPADGLPFSDSPARPLANVPARSSRFFPHVSEQPKKPSSEKVDYQRSPSPPPPEEVSSHPVYFGDSGKPLVHLPMPKPVVKLPPKAKAAPASPPTFASMAAAPPRPAPSSTAISWQEKINGLFGKKTPPEKKSVLAVASASKEPLDVQLQAASVSVSLPHIVESASQIAEGHGAVRQVEEQDEIFEDPPSPSRLRVKNSKQMQVHSVEPYLVGLNDRDQSGNLRVLIRLPGAIAAKTFLLPKKAAHSRHRGTSNLKNRRGNKPREGSGGSGSSKKPASSQQSSAPSSSPRHQSRTGSWGPRTNSGPR